MIRFGVCSLEDLYANRLSDAFGKEKNISIELYEELFHNDAPSASEYQEIVLSRFKCGQVFKRTHLQRFSEFDTATLSAVQKQFRQARNELLAVHDLAASDGRTSLELYHQLINLFNDGFSFLATDVLPWVYSVGKPSERLRVITDDGGRTMEIVYPPFVFNLARQESKFYWINKVLVKRLQKEAATLSALFVQRSSEVRARKISLIHKKCRELSERGGNFSFEQYNVLEPINRRFDMVRAMNILNPGYFNQREISRILESVFSSLRAGGLFVTGSNEGRESGVEGGIYLRAEAGFHLLFASGSGSCVHEAIARFNR